MPASATACGAIGPNDDVSRSPSQLNGGCGGRHLSAPTGARAYGTPENDQRSPRQTPRTRPPGTVTTPSMEAPYEVFPSRSTTTECASLPLGSVFMHVRARRRAAPPPVMKDEGLLFQGVISALSEHWTPTSTRYFRVRRARRVTTRAGNLLRLRGRRRWHVDADNDCRTGPQSIADQCIESAGERDRRATEPGRAGDIGTRQPLRHGDTKFADRAGRAADDQRHDRSNQGRGGRRSQTSDQ